MTDWKDRISKAATSAAEREGERNFPTEVTSQRRESEYLVNLTLYDEIIKPVFEEAIPLLSIGARVAGIDEKPLISAALQAGKFECVLHVVGYERWGVRTTLVRFSMSKRQDGIELECRIGSGVTSSKVTTKDITRAYLEDLIASLAEDYLSK